MDYEHWLINFNQCNILMLFILRKPSAGFMGDSYFSVKVCVFFKIIYNYYKAILEQKVNFYKKIHFVIAFGFIPMKKQKSFCCKK